VRRFIWSGISTIHANFKKITRYHFTVDKGKQVSTLGHDLMHNHPTLKDALRKHMKTSTDYHLERRLGES
jgi:hypothetical protein